ncbi:hypothetical protein RhiJN_22708 [Ceratobasidium sp. AG-Ba]|nr:hypothetical protein RhiJN_22708 [Ceratobasidium sp. AG-Ba]
MPPLPGLTDMEEAVKVWIDSMKTQGYNDDECRWLSDRIERLLGVVRSFDETQYNGLSSMTSNLYEIYETFQKDSRAKWKSGVLNAERRHSMIRDLNHKIDNLVEASKLDAVHQLLSIQQTQSRRHNIDNFPTIAPYEMTDQIDLQTIERDESHFTNPLYPKYDDSVVVGARRGKHKNLQVVLKTYTSRSDGNAAAKAAEWDLKFFSSSLHPNIANVVGVTKGYYGMNGYAVACGIPLTDYWPKVRDGVAFAKILRGLEAADSFTGYAARLHITVDDGGNVIVVPDWELVDPEDDLPALWHFSKWRDRILPNPIADMAADIYYHNEGTRDKFIDAVGVLDQYGFSELGVARIAAELRMISCARIITWSGQAPSTIIRTGDIGSIDQWDSEVMGWNRLLNDGRSSDTFYYSWDPYWRNPGVTHGDWISTRLSSTPPAKITWRPLAMETREDVHAMSERARDALRDRSIDVAKACYCDHIWCSAQIDRGEQTVASDGALYFHCNPSKASDPRSYWGFLSTSSNPEEVTALATGYSIQFRIFITILCFSDLWEHKYSEMVNSGLDAIPGGYPTGSTGRVPASDEFEWQGHKCNTYIANRFSITRFG